MVSTDCEQDERHVVTVAAGRLATLHGTEEGRTLKGATVAGKVSWLRVAQ